MTPQHQPPAILPVQPQGIPLELQSRDHWVLWRLEPREKANGEVTWTKVPYTEGGTKAASDNPRTWTTYSRALAAYGKGGFHGIGLILIDGLNGIDVDDCRDPVTGALSDFAIEILERVEGYAEISPTGTGIKIFTKTDLKGSRTKKEVGLELYENGRYFTITGHSVNGHANLPAAVQPIGWLLDKVWGQGSAGRSLSLTQAQGDFAHYKPPLSDWSLDRVRAEIVPYIDTECHYEDWFGVALCLHHQFNGAIEAFELWDEIFRNSSKYGGREYGWKKWQSIKQTAPKGKSTKTLASLIAVARDTKNQAQKQKRNDLVTGLKTDIAAVTDPSDLQDRLAPRVAKAEILTDIDREILGVAIQAKAKELGVKLPIATVRDWVKPPVVLGNLSMPKWAHDWIYVTDSDKFFNLVSKQDVTPRGFRAMFNRQMPLDQAGNREWADQYALEQWGMPVAHHKGYMPSAGPVFEMFGLRWANLYRPESVPEIPAQFSADDLVAIDLVKKHLKVYLSDDRERDLLLSWLAHNVQHPGVKIRWAPYLHGVPGDGKTFFAELAAVAMGGQNVRVVNGSTLESNFTDWAVGTALTVIEEMKQHGHNRFDIMNRVKPVITNSVIEVHPKGKASYTAPNHTNYIITSNYLDGAPVDEEDRRYMFLSSSLTAARAQYLSEQGYFANLFQALQDCPGAIRKWLLEASLHPEFDPNGRAPHTEIKNTVIEMSKSDLEHAIEDLLETGVEGVTGQVISSAHLSRALSVRGHDGLSTTRLHHMLTRLRFRYLGRKKWKGQACRIWIKEGLQMDEAGALAALSQVSEFEFLG